MANDAAMDDYEPLLTPEEREVLEADSPTLAKMLLAQEAALRALRGTANEIAEHQEAERAAEYAATQAEIQAAIDANKTLAEWQPAPDRTMWDQAQRLDRMLREEPQYAKVPFAE